MILAAPAPDLRSLVTSYTGYRIQGEPAGVHRGLPSRSLTVVLTIEGTVDIGGARRARGYGSYRALASGLHDEVVLIEHDGNQYGLQADLTPLGARALLGLPAGALAGAIVDLDALLGPAAGELIDRLRAAPTWPERFEHLDSVLSRVANPTDVPAELAWVWRRLTGSGGALPIGALATEVGWSRQRVARVIRFESAHRLLAASPRSRIADIAARSGYYDQAHLDRDWRALTGLSPTAWLSHELPFVQDGTADER